MDISLRDKFVGLWAKYFDGAALPICFYYANDPGGLTPRPPAQGHVCMIGQLALPQRGQDLCLDSASIGCFGGKKYTGFSQAVMPNFEYFLSCGIAGKLEGERYKKTPQLVQEFMSHQPPFVAPGKYLIFKRWDKLDVADEPAVAIFLATPDVLAGLFTLAGFDVSDPQAVISPFGAGCGTIVQQPYAQKDLPDPKAVLGLFDVSARPYVPAGVLSFAVPMAKLRTMIANMDESFLITNSWAKVLRRIEKQERPG